MIDFESLYTSGPSHRIPISDDCFLRLRDEPDLHTTISDFKDCYGEVYPTARDRDTGLRKERPSTFNGAARLIITNDGSWWWQPPKELIESKSEPVKNAMILNAISATIKDILNYGFTTYILELCKGADAYGKPIVVAYACLSGVEPFIPSADMAWMLTDLYDDLRHTNELAEKLLPELNDIQMEALS